MSDNQLAQLQMIWPRDLLESPPRIELAPGYLIRNFQPGDEQNFYQLMDLAGWPGWDEDRLEPWIKRIVPGSWFMILDDSTDIIVATCMGIHDHQPWHPFGAEIGWLASDPNHRGKGLGYAVSAATTRRLIDAGYTNIHLFSEDYRPAALKIYLQLGFVPDLFEDDMYQRWLAICQQIDWPFEPEIWKEKIGFSR